MPVGLREYNNIISKHCIGNSLKGYLLKVGNSVKYRLKATESAAVLRIVVLFAGILIVSPW